MIKAVIFDLDGVLAKTDSYHYLSWKKICDNHHYTFDKDINDELRGVSREECLNIILKHNKAHLIDVDFNKVLEEENINYENIIMNLTPNDLFPGSIEILTNLKIRGIKLAIGTITKHGEFVIDKLGIRKYFDVIVDGNMVKKPKPDPECFLSCTKVLGVDPSETLVIEDADSGIVAANKGGYISVAVRSGVKNNLAKYNIDEFNEILGLLN